MGFLRDTIYRIGKCRYGNLENYNWLVYETNPCQKNLALAGGIFGVVWGLIGREGLPKQEEDEDKKQREIKEAEPQPALEQDTEFSE